MGGGRCRGIRTMGFRMGIPWCDWSHGALLEAADGIGDVGVSDLDGREYTNVIDLN